MVRKNKILAYREIVWVNLKEIYEKFGKKKTGCGILIITESISITL